MKGDICRKHGCSYCCRGTEMSLTNDDIRRIEDSGKREFYHPDRRELKNIDGRCFFLDEVGNCEIYDIRPRGCRLYPLIMALPMMQPVLDEDCPHRSEFGIDPEEVMDLRDLIGELMEEGSI